jgi:hypothetical protein
MPLVIGFDFTMAVWAKWNAIIEGILSAVSLLDYVMASNTSVFSFVTQTAKSLTSNKSFSFD